MRRCPHGRRSRQLGFDGEKRRDFDNYYPELKCLRRGSNRYAYNISSGQWGDVYATAFDYHYETHSTDSKGNRQTHHHHYSCLLLKPEHAMKPLLIRREGLFDKIKAGFGYDDIDFESAEFSKRFYVTAKDKRWAYDVIHTRAMEMLLADGTRMASASSATTAPSASLQRSRSTRRASSAPTATGMPCSTGSRNTPGRACQSNKLMEPTIILFLALSIVPLFWFIGNFNGLVRLRNHCRESWSGIDTELKRRHDLIPNLVKTVQAYAKHERSVFESVTEARAAAARPHRSPGDQARDENRLVVSLGGLFAVAEGYPELKSDRNFLQLQDELVNTEDRIQAARRLHNANVRDLGNRIEMFPSSIVASMFNFERWDFFEIDSLSERIAPKVEMG